MKDTLTDASGSTIPIVARLDSYHNPELSFVVFLSSASRFPSHCRPARLSFGRATWRSSQSYRKHQHFTSLRRRLWQAARFRLAVTVDTNMAFDWYLI